MFFRFVLSYFLRTFLWHCYINSPITMTPITAQLSKPKQEYFLHQHSIFSHSEAITQIYWWIPVVPRFKSINPDAITLLPSCLHQYCSFLKGPAVSRCPGRCSILPYRFLKYSRPMLIDQRCWFPLLFRWNFVAKDP